MKRKMLSLPAALVVAAFITAIACGCWPFDSKQSGMSPSGSSSGSETGSSKEAPQLGLNFIRFYWSDRPGTDLDKTTEYYQPSWIFKDFGELGAQAYRQLIKADLLWDVVEPEDNQWNWQAADSVLKNPDFTPIVTLFKLQYASPNPPWATAATPFQKTLGPEAQDYLDNVVGRYAPYVKYWELGNEMDHWRMSNPADTGPANKRGKPGGPNRQGQEEKHPACWPTDEFTPQQQGAFLAQAAQFIRERDPDAVIVMPGMSSVEDYNLGTWLPGVIQGGGSDWFDVVNYHYYSGWEPYGLMRDRLRDFLKSSALEANPVWMTETGSTADPTLTIRTNYPNSPESQAADVFRRIVQAYGHGDSLTCWHTYISSSNTGGDGSWRAYGIRTDTAGAQPSYYAFKLLAHELIPFKSFEALAADPRAANVYKVTTGSSAVRYVAWGSGEYAVPAGVTKMTSVIPNPDGGYSWQAVKAGATISLSANPVLIE